MKLHIYPLFTAVAVSLMVGSGSCFGGLMLSQSDIIITGYTPAQSNPKEGDILDYLQGSTNYSSISGIGELLFKWEQDAGEEASPLSSSYDVVNLESDGKLGGTIDYISGDIVDTSNAAWLVVKGGQSGFVVYDLDSTGAFGVNWDGMDDLVFTNAGLFNNKGELQAISNLQIWGGSGPVPTPGPGPSPNNGVVPEPTTLAIWSVLGVCGLAVRRRRAKK